MIRNLVLKLPGGVVFKLTLDLDVPHDANVAKLLDSGQVYEPDVSSVFKTVLQPGDTVIDVGANLGYFVAFAAAMIGSSGRVVAFEPGPVALQRLKYNVRLNQAEHQVRIVEAPASDHSGDCAFYIHSEDAGGSALWDSAGTECNRVGTLRLCVQGTTIDEQLQGLVPGPIKLLKIDTEGAEAAVLRGARRAMSERGIEFIVCEIHPFGLIKMGETTESLRAWMVTQGYDAFALSVKGAVPWLVPRNTRLHFSTVANVLFAKLSSVEKYWTDAHFEVGAF